VSTRCHTCDEALEDDARFCGACGVSLVDDNYGRTIANRYVLRQRIGVGSLGAVYKAEQKGVGRKLAIKLLPDTRNPTIVERFRREGHVLVNLRSHHTVTTYELGSEPDGSLYIAMELSAGRSLAQVLRHDGPLPWQSVMRILVGLCSSLGEAHALGVVHRDLKPKNILVEHRATEPYFVKVSDFGLAKILGANLRISPVGQNVGAVELASPEGLLDRPIDGRADLYGLGVLAFLLITGTHPFRESRTFGEMVAAHISKVPVPVSSLRPEVPRDVDALIACLLEKDPNRRYPDTATLAAQIDLLLSGLPPDPTATIRTHDGEEDTYLAEAPKK
jgi:eukaryotic-like serine/threonine-protein kinase